MHLVTNGWVYSSSLERVEVGLNKNRPFELYVLSAFHAYARTLASDGDLRIFLLTSDCTYSTFVKKWCLVRDRRGSVGDKPELSISRGSDLRDRTEMTAERELQGTKKVDQIFFIGKQNIPKKAMATSRFCEHLLPLCPYDGTHWE